MQVPSAAQCSAGCWVLGAGAAMPTSESRPSSQSEWQSPQEHGRPQYSVSSLRQSWPPVTCTRTLWATELWRPRRRCLHLAWKRQHIMFWKMEKALWVPGTPGHYERLWLLFSTINEEQSRDPHLYVCTVPMGPRLYLNISPAAACSLVTCFLHIKLELKMWLLLRKIKLQTWTHLHVCED